MPQYSKNFSILPDSIKKIIRHVVTKVQPSKIILFGSRARGDHRENSDFDFAVYEPQDLTAWTQVRVELDDSTLSLYPVDLVLANDLGDDYQRNIKAEGKVIYG